VSAATREEEVHAANPPSAWTVHKAADRCWQVRDVHGAVLETHATKRDAEAARLDGWAAREWADRGAWMAGDEAVRARRHWRPFAEIVAERERWEARNGQPAPWLQ
jgi:hypothetical protein